MHARWLNRYTRENVVKVQENEIVIDEGTKNQVSIVSAHE